MSGASTTGDASTLCRNTSSLFRRPSIKLGAEPDEKKTEMYEQARDAEVEQYAKFTTRVSRAPDQCIRYTFAPDAVPLWPSRRRQPDPSDIPACPRCGAARRFEFQVMPQAINYLGIDSWEVESPDFATIAVYTCSKSCAPTPPLPTSSFLSSRFFWAWALASSKRASSKSLLRVALMVSVGSPSHKVGARVDGVWVVLCAFWDACGSP